MPRSEDQTTIALLGDEKKSLDAAKSAYEQETGQRISAGAFVRVLCVQFLKMRGQGGSLLAAQQARVEEPQVVAPGLVSYQVDCPRCGRVISWPAGLLSGHCPYPDCGIFLVMRWAR